MFEMYEALPVMGGLLTGLVVSMLVGRPLRWLALLTLSTSIGVASATIATATAGGILENGIGSVIFDSLQVLASAWIFLMALSYLSQRTDM